MSFRGFFLVSRAGAFTEFATRFVLLALLVAPIPSVAKADDLNYVSIRKQINCIFRIQKLTNSNGINEADRKKLGLAEGISGQINGMQCAIIEKGAAGAKEIGLSSNEIRNGMIQTKDFGAIKMVMDGSGLTDLEMQQSYLGNLIEFLQK